jgi:hypothetical protein
MKTKLILGKSVNNNVYNSVWDLYGSFGELFYNSVDMSIRCQVYGSIYNLVDNSVYSSLSISLYRKIRK